MPEPSKPDSLPSQVSDLIASTKAYALQETVDPVKRAAKGIGFGIGGGALTAIGAVLLALSLLRLLQTETFDSWGRDGFASAFPYLIVVVVCGAIIGLAVWKIMNNEVTKDRR